MEDYKKKLQIKILEIVKDIDKVCKQNNIPYYLAYGSCLGAVRHKGFIPWDDDFDIMLKYEDYKRFLEACKKDLAPNKYFVQTLETDPNYYLSFAKIRNIQTTLIEESNKFENMVNGVYIDIFPLVGYPDNKLKQLFFKINRAAALSANRNVINNKFLYRFFKLLLKLFGKKNIINYCTKQCIKYNCDDYEQLVSVFDGDGIDINLTSNTILGKPKYVLFEDIELPIPEQYDIYLKHIYGNYMELPSKEQIEFQTHTPYILDLEHSYEEYKQQNNKEKTWKKDLQTSNY